ncbi:unnamed protein product [Moneuplotes crassus]|uniref:Uncharacterized protein n=1 Tax=Euplotes crassus TaxID=5936 RepID=A0AAD1XW46_EUPCR|nr:unnamed protein product [Moneuplotes crassus]
MEPLSEGKPSQTHKTKERVSCKDSGFDKPAEFHDQSDSIKTEKRQKRNDKSNSSSTEVEFLNSSILEQHTIVLESDNEFADDQSDAPTESHDPKSDKSVHFEDSSFVEGGQAATGGEQKSSQKVDSSQSSGKAEKQIKERNSSHNKKSKPQSSIDNGDIPIQKFNNLRNIKTALDKSRIVNKTQDGLDESQEKNHKLSQIKRKELEISPLGEYLKDEIFLTPNSSSKNLDASYALPADTKSISQCTLELQTPSSKPTKSPTSPPIRPPSVQLASKACQISSSQAKTPLKPQKPPLTTQTTQTIPIPSSFNKASKASMPATSSIQLSGGQKDNTSSSEIPKPDHKDPPRRGKKKPFEYKKGRSKHQNVGASSQISEEKKMDERITHTRADIRPHNDDSMPDFKQIENKSVEYYAPAVRKISEADAKESSIGMPQGVQIDLGSSEVEKRADEGDQVDLGESEQERVKEKASEGVQIDLGDSSTRVQRMGKNNASEGVQIDLGDSSTRVQAVGKNNASEGIQIDFGDSESDIPIGFTNNISEGIQIDFGDSSTETKRKSQDNISEGIQIDFEEESEQIQRYPRNRISEGMQIDIDTRSQGIKAHPEPGVSVGNQYDLNNKISQRIQKLPERTHRRGIQADPYPTRTQGIQIYPDSTKSQGLQISPEKMKSEGFQIRPEPQKCEGVQMSAISVTSEGNQVGTSILTPVSYISVGNKGIQFDADNYNRSIQADEQPLKDIDIQCDRSENEKEIQADPEYISRGQSAGSGSLLSPFRANEVEDYHYHRPISRDSNLIDFSCQFSYHTVESTEGEINISKC